MLLVASPGERETEEESRSGGVSRGVSLEGCLDGCSRPSRSSSVKMEGAEMLDRSESEEKKPEGAGNEDEREGRGGERMEGVVEGNVGLL